MSNEISSIWRVGTVLSRWCPWFTEGCDSSDSYISYIIRWVEVNGCCVTVADIKLLLILAVTHHVPSVVVQVLLI